MSLAVVLARGLAGLDPPPVFFEGGLGGGLPAFKRVGLPDTDVKKAGDRVCAGQPIG
jgi:hypothetical protein